MNVEFKIGGNDYSAGVLDCFQQLHVSRKIAPLIPALVPAFMEIAKTMPASLKAMAAKGNESALSPDDIKRIAPLLQPFADALTNLSDADAEYVFSTCLSVVRRKTDGMWAPIWNKAARAPMFDDINDLGSLIPIVVRVIVGNLGPFIRGLRMSQQETSGAPSVA